MGVYFDSEEVEIDRFHKKAFIVSNVPLGQVLPSGRVSITADCMCRAEMEFEVETMIAELRQLVEDTFPKNK